ncbi:Transmembrane channel-like protein 7 [Bagarius yarrelli]|uniref:Transmembrane channel-like protein n=1 Tax=Bagarius yarrelli TaxID=175774 RepID=A0A556U1G3_BAGYA|nr:Transmembrane channel-like protein 7 [Bagarius yarrelli]
MHTVSTNQLTFHCRTNAIRVSRGSYDQGHLRVCHVYYNGSHYGSIRAHKSSLSRVNAGEVQFDWGSRPTEEDGKDENYTKAQNLKELPLHMGLKKAIRQVQQMRVPVVSTWGSWYLTCRYSKSFHRFRGDLAGIFSLVELWRKSMHQIGGHFGGGVQSYFLFLRFLVILNFLSFLLMAGFIIIPSIVFHSNNSSGQLLVPSVNLSGVEVCLRYDIQLQPLTIYYTYFLDLLSGTGFMEYSYMFYGFYNNTEVTSNGFSYNIPLAYLLTAAFYFLFCLLCIVVRMGGVARVVMAMDGGRLGGYSVIVFTGWDHGLQDQRAANVKQNNLRYRLQVDLEEERIKKKAKSLTLSQAFLLYSLRLFLNLIILAMIAGAFFAISYATQYSQSQQQEGIAGLLLEYLPSIIITVCNFVVPLLCDQIANFEKYSPSVTVILALLRAVFLRLVSLAVLLITLWQKITCEGNIKAQTCSPCSYNFAQYQCWETCVGQELYKLMLFDFLITIAVIVLVEFPRRLVVDHCSCKLAQWVGRQEFVVPSNVLALVYAQTVVWSGALFCPMLPLINTLKFIIIFYSKKASSLLLVTLFQNCRPALKTFRSTSSNFFFFLVLLFGLVISSVVLIYSVSSIHPSYSCGPFRFSSSMWDTVPHSFHSLSNTTQEFLLYVGSQAFSIPLFLLSCVVMCYMAALASVYGKTVNLLKKQHKLEGRDKQFLVKQIKELNAKVSKSEQDAPPRDSRRTRDSRNQSGAIPSLSPRWRENCNSAFEPDEEPAMSSRDLRNRGFYDRDI